MFFSYANDSSVDFSTVSDVMKKIRTEYYEFEDEEKLSLSALRCLMSSLDKYSSYLDDQEYRDFQLESRGEIEGIGLELVDSGGVIEVRSILENSPAERVGIKPGDIIAEVDGCAFDGVNFLKYASKIRGRVGTSVSILIKRDERLISVCPIRAIIKSSFVYSEFVDGIAYIKIGFFADGLSELVYNEISTIAAKNEIKGMLVDLRNNPGGLLEQAVNICDIFLPIGKNIVSVKARKKNEMNRYSAKSSFNTNNPDLLDVLKNTPMVLLINEFSASASEIVSAALKENKRAVIVGKKSFGKASIQKLIPLGAGKGAIRITTAVYYTPLNNIIQDCGVVPDFSVEYENKCLASGEKRDIYECDTQVVAALKLMSNVKENLGT